MKIIKTISLFSVIAFAFITYNVTYQFNNENYINNNIENSTFATSNGVYWGDFTIDQNSVTKGTTGYNFVIDFPASKNTWVPKVGASLSGFYTYDIEKNFSKDDNNSGNLVVNWPELDNTKTYDVRVYFVTGTDDLGNDTIDYTSPGQFIGILDPNSPSVGNDFTSASNSSFKNFNASNLTTNSATLSFLYDNEIYDSEILRITYDRKNDLTDAPIDITSSINNLGKLYSINIDSLDSNTEYNFNIGYNTTQNLAVDKEVTFNFTTLFNVASNSNFNFQTITTNSDSATIRLLYNQNLYDSVITKYEYAKKGSLIYTDITNSVVDNGDGTVDINVNGLSSNTNYTLRVTYTTNNSGSTSNVTYDFLTSSSAFNSASDSSFTFSSRNITDKTASIDVAYDKNLFDSVITKVEYKLSGASSFNDITSQWIDSDGDNIYNLNLNNLVSDSSYELVITYTTSSDMLPKSETVEYTFSTLSSSFNSAGSTDFSLVVENKTSSSVELTLNYNDNLFDSTITKYEYSEVGFNNWNDITNSVIDNNNGTYRIIISNLNSDSNYKLRITYTIDSNNNTNQTEFDFDTNTAFNSANNNSFEFSQLHSDFDSVELNIKYEASKYNSIVKKVEYKEKNNSKLTNITNLWVDFDSDNNYQLSINNLSDSTDYELSITYTINSAIPATTQIVSYDFNTKNFNSATDDNFEFVSSNSVIGYNSADLFFSYDRNNYDSIVTSAILTDANANIVKIFTIDDFLNNNNYFELLIDNLNESTTYNIQITYTTDSQGSTNEKIFIFNTRAFVSASQDNYSVNYYIDQDNNYNFVVLGNDNTDSKVVSIEINGTKYNYANYGQENNKFKYQFKIPTDEINWSDSNIINISYTNNSLNNLSVYQVPNNKVINNNPNINDNSSLWLYIGSAASGLLVLLLLIFGIHYFKKKKNATAKLGNASSLDDDLFDDLEDDKPKKNKEDDDGSLDMMFGVDDEDDDLLGFGDESKNDKEEDDILDM